MKIIDNLLNKFIEQAPFQDYLKKLIIVAI